MDDGHGNKYRLVVGEAAPEYVLGGVSGFGRAVKLRPEDFLAHAVP